MAREHHFETYMYVADDGRISGPYIGDQEMDDKVFDPETCEWMSLDETSPFWDDDQRAMLQLHATRALPEQIIDIYRQWTGPNGYDINIMSDIAALLVKGGWVAEDDLIVEGEWPDDDSGLLNGVPSSMVIIHNEEE